MNACVELIECMNGDHKKENGWVKIKNWALYPFVSKIVNQTTLQPLKNLIEVMFILKSYYNKIELTWLQRYLLIICIDIILSHHLLRLNV